MTEITRWRPPGPAKHFHLPLPEPPRWRHVSKLAREPQDKTARALDDWLKDVAVTTTHDAD